MRLEWLSKAMPEGRILAALAFAITLATGLLWYRRIQAVAIPENRLPFVGAAAAGAIVGLLALSNGPGWLGGALAVLAVLGGGFIVFTYAVSAQKGGTGRFRVGQLVPDFTAPDENDQPVALASFAGRPLLLKFFRGHW